MDHDFITEAERLTSFNLSISHFQSLDRKKEIQHLFQKHFFPSINQTFSVPVIDKDRYNAAIDLIKREHSDTFSFMHDYVMKGIGPSEVSMYVLVDTAKLGGGSSAGLDVTDAEGERELKAVKVSKDGYAYDFKLGGTINLAQIITDLCTLKLECDIFEGEGVSPLVVNRIATERPLEFRKITDDFREAVRPYFCKHEVIFVNHSKSLKTQGRIEAITIPKPEHIEIHCVTSGTMKPRIKIHGIN